MTPTETPRLIRSLSGPQGQPVIIEPTHVARTAEGGYRIVSGVGRRASAAGAAR